MKFTSVAFLKPRVSLCCHCFVSCWERVAMIVLRTQTSKLVFLG